ncbi:C-type lectin mannose-binding isoform-like [Saccoglossus kowalevskii]|uniref:C-type lectin-like n=1 Tax=Saccoglossus kowalevskii TaxID=10224 RepID=A0ABM0N0R6_SACKO|nr:PREDICTED: C-type lectin-like [Saccoglossus kowalevskii]
MKYTVFVLFVFCYLAHGQTDDTADTPEEETPVVNNVIDDHGYVSYTRMCNHIPGHTVEYKVYTDEVFWADAEAYCHDNLGGNLARIPDEETYVYMLQYLIDSGAADDVATGFWIGLNDIRNEGVYTWSNGGSFCQNVTALPWGAGEPNNNEKLREEGQDCIQLRKSQAFALDDDYCDHRAKGFICEIPVCVNYHECNVCR